MKTIEVVVLAGFGLFWLVFFILLCYFASRKRRTEGRRDHWRSSEENHKSHSQYVGAIGWFQRYRDRQDDGYLHIIYLIKWMCKLYSFEIQEIPLMSMYSEYLDEMVFSQSMKVSILSAESNGEQLGNSYSDSIYLRTWK